MNKTGCLLYITSEVSINRFNCDKHDTAAHIVFVWISLHLRLKFEIVADDKASLRWVTTWKYIQRHSHFFSYHKFVIRRTQKNFVIISCRWVQMVKFTSVKAINFEEDNWNVPIFVKWNTEIFSFLSKTEKNNQTYDFSNTFVYFYFDSTQFK